MNLAGSKRAGMAFEHKAKCFLSIHFNGNRSAAVRGTETFYRAPENRNLNLDEDKAFAAEVQTAVLGALKALDPNAKDRGIKPDTQTQLGAIGVLNDQRLGNHQRPGDMCRAALVEIEFITNAAADRLLVSGSEGLRTVPRSWRRWPRACAST